MKKRQPLIIDKKLLKSCNKVKKIIEDEEEKEITSGSKKRSDRII